MRFAATSEPVSLRCALYGGCFISRTPRKLRRLFVPPTPRPSAVLLTSLRRRRREVAVSESRQDQRIQSANLVARVDADATPGDFIAALARLLRRLRDSGALSLPRSKEDQGRGEQPAGKANTKRDDAGE
jgi:hypothetical protein